MGAWIRRAKDVDVISDELYGRMMKEFGRRGYRTTEPGEQYPRETPERFERLVYRAYGEEVIGDGRASELLAIDRAEYRQRYTQAESGIARVGVRHGREYLD